VVKEVMSSEKRSLRIRDSQHGWQSFRFRESWEERKTGLGFGGTFEKAFDEVIAD